MSALDCDIPLCLSGNLDSVSDLSLFQEKSPKEEK
jgi:hypothetical protein